MKLKGLTKLVLAGTALAATAATLTTATYAWYVTNAQVDATGVSGSVASTSTGSLYIAKNTIVSNADVPGAYRTEIALEPAGKTTGENPTWKAEDKAAGKFTFDELIPQSKTANDVFSYTKASTFSSTTAGEASPGGYYTYNANTQAYERAATQPTSENFGSQNYYTRTQVAAANDWVDDKGKTTTGTFISFKYWLKSNTTGNVTVKLLVDNTTSASTNAQITLDPTALPTGVGQGDSFIADAVHALRMSVTKTVYDSSVTAGEVTYTQATGTYVEGTTYYERSGESEPYTYTAVDATGFVAGETSVASYYTKTVGASTTAYTSSATQDQTQTHTYQVDKVALNKTTNLTYQTANTSAVTTNNIAFAEGGDANQYYNALTGLKPFGTGTNGASTDGNTGETTWGTIGLTANKDTLLEFNIWLEGSDADCWDSCRGQSFTFDFKFELVQS